MKKVTGGILVILFVSAVLLTGGCATKAQTGLGVGAGAGALAGSAIGGDTEGALIGAGVGALGGYLIGSEMDKQDAAREQAVRDQEMNTTVVYVRNSNGSTTPVTLRHIGGGRWRGEKGEVYPSLPTAAQLQGAYGF